MKLILVVAADEAGGIGYQNALLCHLPADLKHFKKVTLGKPILMGRKTFESIGHPLKGRENVVLTSQSMPIPGVTTVHTLEEAFDKLQAAPEVMVIGGATLYEQTLPLASEVYLTRIHHRFNADTFFPTLNANEWQKKVLGKQEPDEHHTQAMTFYHYRRLGQGV